MVYRLLIILLFLTSCVSDNKRTDDVKEVNHKSYLHQIEVNEEVLNFIKEYIDHVSSEGSYSIYHAVIEEKDWETNIIMEPLLHYSMTDDFYNLGYLDVKNKTVFISLRSRSVIKKSNAYEEELSEFLKMKAGGIFFNDYSEATSVIREVFPWQLTIDRDGNTKILKEGVRTPVIPPMVEFTLPLDKNKNK